MSSVGDSDTGRRRTLAKYVLLQLPGLALVVGGLTLAVWFYELSTTLAGGIVALWVVKDAVMYPIVRVAYEPGEPDATKQLVGATGIAQARIDAEGWVKVGAELWRARLERGAPPIEKGASVRVVAVHGLTLQVEAA